MISETTENASSNPASGVTQGSRRDESTCAINRWLVLGSGAGSGAGWTGKGPDEAAGAVCRGTSILAIPFLGSGMLTNYRDEQPFCQPYAGPPRCRILAGRPDLPRFAAPRATSTLPWRRFDFSFALIST
jgi:hypothetical protein